MSTVFAESQAPSRGSRLDPRALLHRSFTANAPLTILGLAMLLTLAGTMVGMVVDRQVITGAPAWVKPAKFAISISVYSFSLVYLLGFVQGHARLVRLISTAIVLLLTVEMVIITGQVVRGTTSHFNYATPLDSALFITMAVSIVLVWLLTLAIAVLLLAQRLADPVWAWALRLGLLLALVGMAVAFFMTSPTPAQRAAAQATGRMPVSGAHTVGLPDGGPGLPFLGWSTVAGDLRVPHFFGLHGIQVMLVVGWLIVRIVRLRMARKVVLVWIAGVGYLGLIALLTWQALRGQSLIAPDRITLAATGVLVGGVVLAATLVFWTDSRSARMGTA
jgi:hypothetical protein